VSHLSPNDVRHLPLFRALSDAHTQELLAAFSPRKCPAGTTLFREGEVPATFLLLTAGEVELTDATEPSFVVHPIAPLGELGALTGLPRNTTAVAKTDVEVLEAPVDALHRLFSTSGELAATFYRGLLDTVADKVRRGKRRLDEMRQNLIRTQKSMKQLREVVLSSEETSVSKPVCDALDDLIERNRRSHYRVNPLPGHQAALKLEGKGRVPVLELSDGFLKFERPEQALAVGEEVSAVLILPQREIAVSGGVVRSGTDGVVMKLDLLIDDYRAALEGYVTQLQLLDVVV
jgi:CRP/FNR family transcriptional regulator, cyclic AMP receptor protein